LGRSSNGLAGLDLENSVANVLKINNVLMSPFRALFKQAGFNLQQSLASSFFTYALPGQLVMTESFLVGASIINIFLSVWLVNFRLYPMAVALVPVLKHKSQPRWKYYLSCHFIAVSSWLIAKNEYLKIDKKFRIDLWIGIGSGILIVAVFSTYLGYTVSDYLNQSMMIGLARVVKKFMIKFNRN
jgi:predicted branched-subunit amino acid permease